MSARLQAWVLQTLHFSTAALTMGWKAVYER